MPLENFGLVDTRGTARFFRHAQPDYDALHTLVSLGVKTIIRLNEGGFPVESEQSHFKTYGDGEVVFNPIATFTVDLNKSVAIARQIDGLLSEGKTVSIHCAHGRDRTGFIVGIYRLLFNKSSLSDVDTERQIYGVNWLVDIADHEIKEGLAAVAAGES